MECIEQGLISIIFLKSALTSVTHALCFISDKDFCSMT